MRERSGGKRRGAHISIHGFRRVRVAAARFSAGRSAGSTLDEDQTPVERGRPHIERFGVFGEAYRSRAHAIEGNSTITNICGAGEPSISSDVLRSIVLRINFCASRY